MNGRASMEHEWKLDLGATSLPDGSSFRVWAPFAHSVSVVSADSSDRKFKVKLEKEVYGYFSGYHPVLEGTDYYYLIDDVKRRPDPASRFQPFGVHGPSRIVNPDSFKWSDQGWNGIKKDDLIIYELHVGTFTKSGRFDSVENELTYLHRDLGVTAIEIMPVAQFPGRRNWGYDGTYIYAPQNSYGGPNGLKHLINACHHEGLAVTLDVVYNHLGPEGNYLGDFGPYFSDKYRTFWGSAINFDSAFSDQVRYYITQNALYWMNEFHVDALRLDAVHGIFDSSAKHILREISVNTHAMARKSNRKFYVIAESDLNDPRLISTVNEGGYEIDAQWNDDFHHSIHSYLTGERFGYYADYGSIDDVCKAIQQGFVYDGKYSVYRHRTFGLSTAEKTGDKFVIYSQNHDQVGNRPDGKRLSQILSRPQLYFAAALTILSQGIPLIFMGEEYGEKSPFFYFIDHSDQNLVEAVRSGRKKEFASHQWEAEFTDPQSESTFVRSKLNQNLKSREPNRSLLRYYQELLRLRKSHPALQVFRRDAMKIKVIEESQVLLMHRFVKDDFLLVVFAFGKERLQIPNPFKIGTWAKIHDSTRFQKSDASPIRIPKKKEVSFTPAPMSVTVYQRKS